MFALSSLGLALPWFSSLIDPQAAAIRDLQQQEKQHCERAQQAEQRGHLDQASTERNKERECHNRAIQLLIELTRQKLVDCRRHGWTDAAHQHEVELASLEQQIWHASPADVVQMFEQHQPVTLDQYNPIEHSHLSQASSTNESSLSPPSYEESVGGHR